MTAVRRRIGFLLFRDFELLDVFGPAEMFGVLNKLPGLEDSVELVMIAEHSDPVVSAQGTTVVVDATFEQASKLDVLLVPGGMGTREQVENAVVLDWIREQADAVDWLTSVCTGSGLLAKAGVLDGFRATSNKFAFKWVESQGPGVEWVYKARWIEDRNRWTSSGVSAGMDMSLALIERMYGAEIADHVTNLTEYQRTRDADDDPFARLYDGR